MDKTEQPSKKQIILISGALGSGKTTLIRYILSSQHNYKCAVIQNEFSEGWIIRNGHWESDYDWCRRQAFQWDLRDAQRLPLLLSQRWSLQSHWVFLQWSEIQYSIHSCGVQWIGWYFTSKLIRQSSHCGPMTWWSFQPSCALSLP